MTEVDKLQRVEEIDAEVHDLLPVALDEAILASQTIRAFERIRKLEEEKARLLKLDRAP